MARRVLHEQPGRSVILEDDGETVRKTHTGPDGERLARVELERLERAHAALAELPGARCPEPRGLSGNALRMGYVAAPGILEVLGRRPLTDAELDGIGALVGRVARLYVAASGEAYHDLKLDNVLYDDGELVFLDFGESPVGGPEGEGPLERSMGNLLASALFESARPSRIAHRRLHARAERIVSAAVAELSGELSLPALLVVARRRYAAHTLRRPRAAVRAWYASAGWLGGRRIRLPDGSVAGPVPPWKA